MAGTARLRAIALTHLQCSALRRILNAQMERAIHSALPAMRVLCSQNCSDDAAACAQGETCVERHAFCVATCGSDSDCGAGFKCEDNGRCYPEPETPFDPAACTDDASCDSGQICDRFAECLAECATDSDCLDGMGCSESGYCDWSSPGTECPDDFPHPCYDDNGNLFRCESS